MNINNLSPAAFAFYCYSPAFVLCFDLLVTPYTSFLFFFLTNSPQHTSASFIPQP